MCSSAPIVRRLTTPNAQERTRIIELLQLALLNDNAILCLTDGSRTSERVLYEICMDTCLDNGEVWVTGFDDQIHAVSFWVRPGTDFHIGLSEAYFRHLGDDMKEWMTQHFIPQYNDLYRSSYPNGQQARTEAWHLLLISVQPAFQRRGLGKLLVNVLREMADRQSKCLVVDVQTYSAVLFFNNLGFKYTGVKNFLSCSKCWLIAHDSPAITCITYIFVCHTCG
ncbi:hypothetical protein BJV74DRAFT_442969 [Russula compacta]|nr:hypothetical protein BJV74DRAFT_442969 [Russula compacta]